MPLKVPRAPAQKEDGYLSEPVVQVRGVCHRYGSKVALEDVNLDGLPGQIVGLFGPNGAGKTTLLRILSGLLTQTTGTVSILGQPVRSTLSRVGVVMEQPAFYPQFTAMGNLELAMEYAGRRTTLPERASVLMAVGLEGVNVPVRRFSQGMRQRLGIGIAIAKRPSVLLLDEPTVGLDIDGVEMLGNTLRNLSGYGVACLLSTHEWEIAEQLVDTVAFMRRGRLSLLGRTSELLEPGERLLVRCQHPKVASLLSQLDRVTVTPGSVNDEYVVSGAGAKATAVIEYLVTRGCTPESITPYRQPLSEVYRQFLRAGGEA